MTSQTTGTGPAKPPYRADHVGSLLRPESVKEARRKFYDEKSIDAAQLAAVEDEAIKELRRAHF